MCHGARGPRWAPNVTTAHAAVIHSGSLVVDWTRPRSTSPPPPHPRWTWLIVTADEHACHAEKEREKERELKKKKKNFSPPSDTGVACALPNLCLKTTKFKILVSPDSSSCVRAHRYHQSDFKTIVSASLIVVDAKTRQSRHLITAPHKVLPLCRCCLNIKLTLHEKDIRPNITQNPFAQVFQLHCMCLHPINWLFSSLCSICDESQKHRPFFNVTKDAAISLKPPQD